MSDSDLTLTEDEKDLLRRAGASNALLRLIDESTDGLVRYDGKSIVRHSARQECKKYVRDTHSPAWIDEDSPESFTHMGGGFFSAMWDGDLYGAYCRADPNNKVLLQEVFTSYEVNRTKPPSRKKASF
jgi:hypothetical protein